MSSAIPLVAALFLIPLGVYLAKHIARGVVWADVERQKWKKNNTSRFVE